MNRGCLFEHNHDYGRTSRDGVVQTFRSCLGADPLLEDDVNFRSLLVEYETQHDDDEPAFFYHSDHLGSAAYLTSNGNVVQTLNYLPYGEDWVERNYFSPGDTTRLGIYRFNGKEKDYESGFHYYGARYYWSELLSGWLSVDPMADKYPSISPYAYCAWNPVKLVDPDGRDVEIVKDDENKKVTIRANFYYNKEDIGVAADVFIEGLNAALNSWKNDILVALEDGSLGANGYEVNIEFNTIDCSDPKKSAMNDNFGNGISNDNNIPSNIVSQVGDSKHLTVDFSRNLYSSIEDNPLFYGNEEYQGSLKHEIGHLFGLYDRYKKETGEYATPIANDLMSSDFTRNNAVEPFKRIWRSAGLDQSGSKTVIINKKNREIKN